MDIKYFCFQSSIKESKRNTKMFAPNEKVRVVCGGELYGKTGSVFNIDTYRKSIWVELDDTKEIVHLSTDFVTRI